MKGGRLYSLVLLLATISALQCIPIEIVYTGDTCACPKSLKYVVNVPPPPKEKSYAPSEHGYKLDVPIQGKAKVTYTFDFTVQEPKTPSPIEQEKWDLFAKIDRITAHKKDCIAEEGSPSNSCSCHRCKASRRYVSPPVRAFSTPSYHPNSLSKTQRPPVPTIAWAAVFKPLDRRIQTTQMQIPNLKTRRRRDISRIFLRNRKSQVKKPSPNPMVKQYNKILQAPVPVEKPLATNVFSGQRPFQPFRNFMRLPRFRKKRDIKGEYDLIEKERDEMDLTLPEIIQFMPETLDPDFKRGQCQFGGCSQQQQQNEKEESKTEGEEDAGNTLTSVDKEVKTQSDDDKTDKEEDNKNGISSSHAKRNAAVDFGYEPSYNTYNNGGLAQTSLPYAPSYQSSYHPQHTYSTSAILPRPIAVAGGPYGSPAAPQQYLGPSQAYQMPQQPLAIYGAPPPPYVGAPYSQGPAMYNYNAQLDSVIADIINRHSDFIEAGYHEGGALVDSPADQKQQNKSLFKNLMGSKWHRYVIEDYYGAPKYRRESVTDQPTRSGIVTTVES